MSTVQRVTYPVPGNAHPLEDSLTILSSASALLGLSFEDHVVPDQRQAACFERLLECCLQRDWTCVNEGTLNVLSRLTDTVGRSALLHLIHDRKREAANELVQRNLFIQGTDSEANTPLHAAIEQGLLDLAAALLKHIDVNQKNQRGESPLHIAIQSGQPDCVKFLLQHGANPNRSLNYQTLSITPMMYAVSCGQLKCLEQLCQDDRVRLGLDSTPLGNILHVAVHFQQNLILEWVFNYKAEESLPLLEARNSQGWTPLQYAASLDNVEAAILLARNGANLEAGDRKLRTPLHLAAERDHRNMVETLIFLGGQLDATDEDLKRPVDLACSTKRRLSNLMKLDRSRQQQAPDFSYAPPENLVFKGGGPKGIAYVGAMRALEEQGALIRLKRVAGTSAGALNATFVAFNVSSLETEGMLSQNFGDFLDHPLKMQPLSHLPGAQEAVKHITNLSQAMGSPKETLLNHLKALWRCTGICKGEVLREWVEEKISQRSGESHCTFGELRRKIQAGLPFKHLHIFVTKLNGGNGPEVIRFSSEDEQCDEVIISDAVRASTSIPVAFVPHTLHKKIGGIRRACPELGLFADGGMLYNFPVQAFDEKGYLIQGLSSEEKRCPVFNKRTLGFNLCSSHTPILDPTPITTVWDLAKALTKVYFNAEEILYRMTPYNKHRVIDIDTCGVSLLDFSLTAEKKQDLFQSGRNSTEQFYQTQKTSLSNSFSPRPPRLDGGYQAEELLRSRSEKGLYFVVSCKNEGCIEAYKKKLLYRGVVSQKHSVNMNKAVHETCCPSCSQKRLMFEGIALKGSVCAWNGMKQDGEVRESDAGNWKDPVNVREKVISLAQDWLYLEVTEAR